MRWEQLFSDLADQFEDLADAEMMAELADRQRVALGAVSMGQRIAGAIDRTIRVRTSVGLAVTGRLRKVGPDWLLLEEGVGREALLATAAVTQVEGLSASSGAPIGGVELRLDLRFVLRGLTRDRSPVAVVIRGGVGDPTGLYTETTGTIDRIGADFLELAVHAPWEPRRAASVRSVVLVPLVAVVLVRALPLG
jgi:hypothetical protein